MTHQRERGEGEKEEVERAMEREKKEGVGRGREGGGGQLILLKSMNYRRSKGNYIDVNNSQKKHV